MRTRSPKGPASLGAFLLLTVLLVTSSPAIADQPPRPPAPDTWSEFWREHRYHFLTVFAAQEVEYFYAKEVGVSTEPLLFGSPGWLDDEAYDRLHDGPDAGGFIAAHKMSLTKGMTVGLIAAANGLDWRNGLNDFVGFVEAWKFNIATTNMVKMIAGRRRPALDRADEQALGPQAYAALQKSKGGRESFYSAATSTAFTGMAYADQVLARRLASRPWARRIGFAGLYGFAGVVGISRMRQGAHYLTDVLAGAAAGTLVGRQSYRIHHDDKPALEEARTGRVHFLPPVPLEGGGLMISATIDLPRGF